MSIRNWITTSATITRSWFSSEGRKRFLAGITAFACLSLLCGGALRARADLVPGHDYYNTSGGPVDVTNQIVVLGGTTYLENPPGSEEEMIPIIMDYSGGHIYDGTYYTLIGFIYSAAP